MLGERGRQIGGFASGTRHDFVALTYHVGRFQRQQRDADHRDKSGDQPGRREMPGKASDRPLAFRAYSLENSQRKPEVAGNSLEIGAPGLSGRMVEGG